MKVVIAALLMVICAQSFAAEPRKFLVDEGRTMIVLYETGVVEIYGEPSKLAYEIAARLKAQAEREKGLTKT